MGLSFSSHYLAIGNMRCFELGTQQIFWSWVKPLEGSSKLNSDGARVTLYCKMIRVDWIGDACCGNFGCLFDSYSRVLGSVFLGLKMAWQSGQRMKVVKMDN